MQVFQQISEVKTYISSQKQQHKTIGFVPTMGALHQGHISLINESKKNCDITVCSIFVNPTQFNNANDLTRYPRTPEVDMQLLEQAGCDVLYMPDVKDIYPTTDTRQFNFGYIDTILEAEHRPGHYNGVGQVVSILLAGIEPNKAFFGSKDYQQVMIVKALVKQLKLPVEIISCPILREDDGLAMSSRNMLLTPEERKIAKLVPIMMEEARDIARQIGVSAAKSYIHNEVAKVPIMKLDYYEVCDTETLEPLAALKPNQQAISLIAVFVGNIRLIDNWMVD
jgi:pantoate--beta-alanine ligase